MNPEWAYFLKINAALVLFFAFYRMFLHKDTFFSWRRAVLLCFLGVSLFYPLLNFQGWFKVPETMVVNIAEFYTAVMLPEVEALSTTQTVSWTNFAGSALSFTYWAGVVVLLLRFGVQLACIVRIRLQSRTIYLQGIRVFVPKKVTEPFSFFHWIFLCPDRYTDEELDEILTHELTHACQVHSFDVIFSELMCVACWMNPFAWLLKKEVRNNLEYIADHRVLSSGHDYKSYQYHLLGLAHQKRIATLSNSFNVLPLKKRIRMMNKKRTREIGKTKYLMFLPLAALLLAFSNIEAVARTTSRLAHEAAGLITDADQNPKKKEKPTQESTPAQAVENTQPATPVSEQKIESTDEAYDQVDNMPVYPGGIEALMKFIQETLRYPVIAQENRVQGRVTVQFVVEKDGTPNEIAVVRSLSPETDAEAIRTVSLMPKWHPGTLKGKPVRVKFTVPIVFKLTGGSGDAPSQNAASSPIPSIDLGPLRIVGINGPIPGAMDGGMMPHFPGGKEALIKYLAESPRLERPDSSTAESVAVLFIVNKEGEVTQPMIVGGASTELDAEALRVVRDMPKWIPGDAKEQLAIVYVVPVPFKLAKTK